MDGARHTALSDEALDRELAAAFDVKASPEFVAKIRTRVDRETIRSGPLARLGFVGLMAARWPAAATVAAALVVLAGAAVALFQVTVERASDDGIPASTASAVTPAAPPAAAAARPSASDGIAARVRPGAQGRRESRQRQGSGAGGTRPFPEVVIADADRRGFEMLVSRIRHDELAPLPARPDSESIRLTALEIAPVVVEPLPQMARLE